MVLRARSATARAPTMSTFLMQCAMNWIHTNELLGSANSCRSKSSGEDGIQVLFMRAAYVE
jgi:hypothetical protein